MRERLLARAHAGVSEVTHLEITPHELMEFERETAKPLADAVLDYIDWDEGLGECRYCQKRLPDHWPDCIVLVARRYA